MLTNFNICHVHVFTVILTPYNAKNLNTEKIKLISFHSLFKYYKKLFSIVFGINQKEKCL